MKKTGNIQIIPVIEVETEPIIHIIGNQSEFQDEKIKIKKWEINDTVGIYQIFH